MANIIKRHNNKVLSPVNIPTTEKTQVSLNGTCLKKSLMKLYSRFINSKPRDPGAVYISGGMERLPVRDVFHPGFT